MSCRDADKVAIRFLKSLRIAAHAADPTGGDPPPIPSIGLQSSSTVFTYYSPGDILPGTGFRRKGGVADHTVYSKIRFPLADAPAFANSQSFMNWGNCEATGRSGAGTLGGVRAYRCRVNGQMLVLDESAPENYSYPWRDNFWRNPQLLCRAVSRGSRSPGARHPPGLLQAAHRGGEPLRALSATTWSACATAWCCAHPPRRRLYIVVNAPTSACASATCTCCPSSSTPTAW